MIKKYLDFVNENMLRSERLKNHKPKRKIKTTNGLRFNFKDLTGLTFSEILGLEKGSEYVLFRVNDNNTYFEMYHEQNCCESVYVEDVEGDIKDILNYPIIKAEEITKDDPNAYESGTFTFYKLATIKGYMTIRWYGRSNGCYSERVSFFKNIKNNIKFVF